MAYPFCTVIVLNFQGEKIIEKTINSLKSLNYPKDRFEILVVDNGSKDKSRQVLEQVKDIETIFLPENIGFSAGNNAGIREAKGEYIALLNNDCIVEPDWLNELVKTAQKDKKIFAVNSKIMLGSTNKIQNAGIRIFPNGYAQDIGAAPHNKKQDYEVDRGQYEEEREIDAACGAAVLYRKTVFDEIGLLDESFFLYYEDVELSERARKHGYKIIYYPKAVARHEHAASSEEWSPFFIYHTERGRLLHMLYHFPFLVFLKEYFKFTALAKARFTVRLFTKPDSTKLNWQYIRVSWNIFSNFQLLLSKRKRV